MSVVDPSPGISAGVCATCGKSITHPGPDGECVRCLVSFGFLAEDHEVERGSEGNQPDSVRCVMLTSKSK